MSNLTEWFPAGVKPTRPGIYETRWAKGQNPWRAKFAQYQHWNGETWGGWGMSTDIAEANADSPSARQEPEWRGLAKEQP